MGLLSGSRVRGRPTGRSEFLERMAERIGAVATATAAFGEPVERDGITVIPVARARWGFGGGSGAGRRREEGSGGGGGMVVSPVGFIELRDGEARFRRIFSAAPLLIACGATGALAFLAARRSRSRERDPS